MFNCNIYISKSSVIALLGCLWVSCQFDQNIDPSNVENANTILGSRGLHGYIAYDSPKSPPGYGAGVSFYTAAWSLIDKPLAKFQIGLPGTWIIPDNTDNDSIPLCPIGTLARDNWDERGPTYRDVFQTLEGGLGYWAGNKYRYGAPKFSMNATAQCYDYEIASPGWSFFYDDETLPEERLGIAQLSNRILIPPDAMTFEGKPDGEFMGYAYMALPFTESYDNGTPTGDQSWTCFINTTNFKGPIAFYIPEAWSRISSDYDLIDGRGLDTRPGIIRGGAMEINTVPHYEAVGDDGFTYTKIPQLKFPVDQQGEAILVQGLTFYSKKALFDNMLQGRRRGNLPDGRFLDEGSFTPAISTRSPRYRQREKIIDGIPDVFETIVYDSLVFGLKWKNRTGFPIGQFPQYFKEVRDTMFPVRIDEVPEETGLREVEFPFAENRPPYTSPDEGVWKKPGPVSGPHTVQLNDESLVTYYWYRFIDQPVFQGLDWSEEKREALQELVEKVHRYWSIDQEYMAPPSRGALVTLDHALLVDPPESLAFGYVPIVTRQEHLPN